MVIPLTVSWVPIFPAMPLGISTMPHLNLPAMRCSPGANCPP